MATYDYVCERCGKHYELQVEIRDRNIEQPCPECGQPNRRSLGKTLESGGPGTIQDLRQYMDTKFGGADSYIGAQPSGGLQIKRPWDLATQGGIRTFIPGDPKHVR